MFQPEETSETVELEASSPGPERNLKSAEMRRTLVLEAYEALSSSLHDEPHEPQLPPRVASGQFPLVLATFVRPPSVLQNHPVRHEKVRELVRHTSSSQPPLILAVLPLLSSDLPAFPLYCGDRRTMGWKGPEPRKGPQA